MWARWTLATMLSIAGASSCRAELDLGRVGKPDASDGVLDATDPEEAVPDAAVLDTAVLDAMIQDSSRDTGRDMGPPRWPQFGYDVAQTRHNPDEAQLTPENVSELEPFWSASFTCSLYGGPVVANDLVHVGTYCGDMVALHAGSGTVAWERRVSGSTGNLLFANGNIYYGDRNQRVLAAFDARSGRTVWTATIATGVVDRSPAIWDDVIIQSDDSGELFAFDANTGVRRWHRSIGRHGIASSPAASEGVFFLANLAGTLYAIDAENGDIRWTARVGTDGFSYPAVDEATNTLFVTSTDRRLYAFSARGCGQSACEPIWWGALEHAGGDKGVAIGDGRVYVGAGQVLHAFDTHGCGQQQCSPVWRSPFGDRIRTAPALANGLLYFGTDENILYAVDARDGSVRWSYFTGGSLHQFQSAVSVVGGVIYAAPTFSFKVQTFHRPE